AYYAHSRFPLRTRCSPTNHGPPKKSCATSCTEWRHERATARRVSRRAASVAERPGAEGARSGIVKDLIRLMRSHLGPYKRTLGLIVCLQIVQVAAALTLPTINARIIDHGVIPGNTHYIYKWGVIMLVFALIQGVFSGAAV